MVGKVKELTKSFDPKDMADEGSEFATSESLGFCELIGRVATGLDWFKFVLGLVFAGLFGSATPIFCLFFGEMIDGMSESADSMDALTLQAKIFCFIAGGVFLVSWT